MKSFWQPMKLLLALAMVAFLSPALAQQREPVPAAPDGPPPAAQAAIRDSLVASENVTLDFKDADINNVLKILAKKANVNIVATPDVLGTVTIKLVDVPWDRALDVILKSNGFGSQKQGNVILVTKQENMSKIQADEPLRTEIVNLKFLDAQDAQRILISMMSARGKISILYNRGQKGWKFGSFRIGKEQVAAAMQERENTGGPTQETIAIEKGPAGPVPTKIDYEPEVKSKTLIITDTDAILDRILNVILPQIDRKPKQVLIEARIMEVNRDRLKDIGFDYGTGLDGAATSTLSTVTTNGGQNNIGANALTSQVKPSNFTPSSSAIGSVASNFNTGLTAVFQRLNGTQFEVLMHALEEDVHANTLSSPRILTLDNQEASMLVGYHTPILSSTVTAATATEGATQTQTLDYYQEIGIRLNVVPQIGEDGYINMIIHPSVTSSSHGIDAVNVAGTTNLSTSYPVIDVREAQTQILIRDGETVVIGGLLKDVTSKSVIGIPFLGKIPFLGVFFRRETTSTSKIDLLIFITAHIVTDDEFVPSKVTRIEQQLVDPAKVARQDAIDKKKAAQDAKRANKAKK